MRRELSEPRGSKFAPLASLPFSYRSQLHRLAHPGGPLKTNKAAALAKFLERKLQDPNGLSSIDPPLLRVGLRFQEEESNTLPPLKTSRYHLMTIR
ncbi:hypothetical protein YC2023_119421 [Brassica napus]